MGVVIISTGTRSTQKQRRKVWITAATVCHRRRVPVTSFVFNLFRQIWRASIISSRVARVMRQRVMWAIVISVVRVLWAIVISVVRGPVVVLCRGLMCVGGVGSTQGRWWRSLATPGSLLPANEEPPPPYEDPYWGNGDRHSDYQPLGTQDQSLYLGLQHDGNDGLPPPPYSPRDDSSQHIYEEAGRGR